MQEEKIMNYSGDLFQELLEIGKTIPDKDGAEAAVSYTNGCGSVLTLLCC